jgi:hypothetical protein
LEDGVSRDIAGQEIRGELDALVLQAEELGKAFHEFGFAEPRESFEEDVSAGEDSGDDQFDDLLLAEEDLVEPLVEGAEMLRCIGDFGLGGVIHGGRF